MTRAERRLRITSGSDIPEVKPRSYKGCGCWGIYQPGAAGPFGVVDIGSSTQTVPISFGVVDRSSGAPAGTFVLGGNLGGAGQFPGVGSASNQADGCGTFPGVTTTSGAAGVVPGAAGVVPGTAGVVPGAAGVVPGAFSSFGGVSGDGRVGFISLPSQQGATFLGGQGVSFTGGQVSGQAGVFGVGPQKGSGFPSRVIQEQATLTQTVIRDEFRTLTDLVLHSVAVTRTQFLLVTTTRVTTVVVPTPVNHALAITTSVVVRSSYVTVTEIKSDFRVNVRILTVTSPVIRTVISTSVEAVTSYHTATSTVYVHGGYN
ncbi:elastin-like [Scylla paramamosain]|uniref:elastin-like n=1 Tax=Scylla paramamosain TaxID=85552 RepID=UPI0030829D87